MDLTLSLLSKTSSCCRIRLNFTVTPAFPDPVVAAITPAFPAISSGKRSSSVYLSGCRSVYPWYIKTKINKHCTILDNSICVLLYT